MKLILYGESGVGKSTLADALAQYFNLKKISAGDIMREEAQKLGVSIYEFDQICKENSKYDTFLDEKIEEIGKTQDDVILDGRLAWYFVKTGLKIKLVCDSDEIMRRISEREEISLKEAEEKTRTRQDVYTKRYAQLYPQIPFPPGDEYFDIVFDTTHYGIEEGINVLIKEVEKKLDK